MTKTEAKKKVAELRREAALITNLLTPTPRWIQEQLDHATDLTPEQIRAGIRSALNNIDGISAQLREGLVDESLRSSTRIARATRVAATPRRACLTFSRTRGAQHDYDCEEY